MEIQCERKAINDQVQIPPELALQDSNVDREHPVPFLRMGLYSYSDVLEASADRIGLGSGVTAPEGSCNDIVSSKPKAVTTNAGTSVRSPRFKSVARKCKPESFASREEAYTKSHRHDHHQESRIEGKTTAGFSLKTPYPSPGNAGTALLDIAKDVLR